LTVGKAIFRNPRTYRLEPQIYELGETAVRSVLTTILTGWALASSVQGQAPPDRIAVDLLEGLPCTPFEWIARDGFSPRAALRVPVELEDETYWFQLDTGSEGTVLYGDSLLQARGWEEVERSFVRVRDVKFGGAHLPAARLFIRREHATDGQTVGTLGLDVLVGHLVVLDFPGRRFCALPRVDVPWALRRDLELAPAVIRDGKFFVTTRVGDHVLKHIFYDTGASAFPLTVDHAVWARLTGGDGAQNRREVRVPSWGQEVALVGARAGSGMEVGGARLGAPEVFYLADQPDAFSLWPYAVTGLMGNEAFIDGTVILDLGAEPGFGFRKPDPAG
jgi:hypothetical protein